MHAILKLLLLTLQTLSKADLPAFCLPESERNNLTFANNNNKIMSHLPTVRLIQGYYPSQFAMQYAAYFYLREQMGVNVAFYPDDNPNALFERYGDYTEWCETSTAHDCTEHPPYPVFYYEDIHDDKYDLLFELWDIQEQAANGHQYYHQNNVNFVGFSGVYGDNSWFIPKYLYDADPSCTLLTQLKSNQTIRDMYKNATAPYVDLWHSIWDGRLEDYPFDIVDGSQPLILGSYEGYSISKQSYAMTKNLLGGLDWTFAAFGSEPQLHEIIVELYDRGLPFIANIYSPHPDFAITTETGQIREFEKIALPRNTDNSVSSECYLNSTCNFPLTPLLKLSNPKLASRFPEIEQFAEAYDMLSTDVNQIIAHYEHNKAANSNVSDHELWYNASCAWYQSHPAQGHISLWKQEIIRYDCDSINDGHGCGFPYYYQETTDGSHHYSEPITTNQNIGGYCLNLT
eukprot:303416_1